MNSTELHLWLWSITDEQARERFGIDAQKVKGSLEVRPPNQARTFHGPLKGQTGKP